MDNDRYILMMQRERQHRRESDMLWCLADAQAGKRAFFAVIDKYTAQQQLEKLAARFTCEFRYQHTRRGVVITKKEKLWAKVRRIIRF